MKVPIVTKLALFTNEDVQMRARTGRLRLVDVLTVRFQMLFAVAVVYKRGYLPPGQS